MNTTTQPLTIQGVTIGDKFISPNNKKSKRISTVIDFIERRSMTTGKLISYECIAQHEFMGQSVTFETPFTSVIRYKVK